MSRSISYDFTGRSYVVTGSTRGIGATIAFRLAESGAAVGITGRDADLLVRRRNEFLERGFRCEAFAADLSDLGALTAMAEYFQERFPRVDGLVNNAGINVLEGMGELTAAGVEAVIRVNLTAPMLLTNLFCGQMKEAGGGAVVNIASLSSVTAFRRHAAYCASKEGLLGFTKVAAMELGPFNIRVNSLGPTVVLTELGKAAWAADPSKRAAMEAAIPAGRFVEPDEVAEAALFLLSDGATMINGECILLDGGYMSGKGL